MRGGEGEKNGPFVVFCNDDDDGVGDDGERERASEGAQRIDSSGSSRVVYHCFDGLLLGVKYCSFDFYD